MWHCFKLLSYHRCSIRRRALDVMHTSSDVHAPIEVRELPGRGRGLISTRDIKCGELIFVAKAHGFCHCAPADDYALQCTRAHPFGRACRHRQDLCHGCLVFGRDLAFKCAGACGAQYCSEACKAADEAAGHSHCCKAIGRIHAMTSNKFTPNERASACFLLRAFASERAAARASKENNGGSPAAAPKPACELPPPSLADALLQCAEPCDADGYATREAHRARAVKLAQLQAGALVPKEAALQLLRSEPHNSYTLRDANNAARGWLMYPHASMINHSCLPNTACVASAGGRLAFTALADIACAEELTQSYLTDQTDGASTVSWGFACDCPRCSRTVSQERLDAFDRVHICACGAIVPPWRGGGRACRCHDHHDARLPLHTPTDLVVSTMEVAMAGGRTSTVALYGRVADLGATHSPLVAISPPSRSEAEADHQFLQSLWAAQGAVAGVMAMVHLHADPSLDSWGERAGFGVVQLERLRALLRSRLFDVWSALVPQLAKLSASFEIFNPAIGANMGWHRDGHIAGEFIAHYYLDCPSDGMMDWFEVAVPSREASHGDVAECSINDDDEDDGPSPYALDLGHDDAAERARISRANFVTFERGVAADQRIVVFEDAMLFHRTPLTAHAAGAQLQGERMRPIARVVFHGTDANGGMLGFPSSAVGTAACIEEELPPGLRRALETHAHPRGLTAESLAASFDAYVAGAPSMIECMCSHQEM